MAPENMSFLASGTQPWRLGFLISACCPICVGIVEAIAAGDLPGCEIAVIISNVTGAPGVEAARALGHPVVVMEGRGRDQLDYESAVSALLRTYRVDFVCLEGYVRVLSARFLRDWHGRILTSHRSLLPAFPGRYPAEQALVAGVQYTGCTIHVLGETLDMGAILVQRVVPIEDDDTPGSLTERIAVEERIAYLEGVRRMLSGEYEAQGRRYVLRGNLRPFADVLPGRTTLVLPEPEINEPAA